MKGFLRIVVACLVGFVAGVIWTTLRSDDVEPAPETGGGEVTYSDLDVADGDGRFDGTITVINETEIHTNVLVQVHVYLGDQDVGELSGQATLKPDSSSTVDLVGFDDYRDFSDTTVELLAIPANSTG